MAKGHRQQRTEPTLIVIFLAKNLIFFQNLHLIT